MSDELKRFLAIDFGMKRIGLALCDPLFTFAYPFKTIQNGPKLWKELSVIVSEQSVSLILLGMPFKESGGASSIAEEIIKFKGQLETKFKLEVLLRDERYTSSIAQDIINKTVTKKSKRKEKGLVDQSAAAIILQDYLNEKKF